jgi:hypothetical protein
MTDDGFRLSPDDERMLASLLDEVVPPSADGRLPGAGALGLTHHIARTVERTPMLRPVLEYGLSALADLARKTNPKGFAALSPPERADLWREFAASDQFFLPAFLFLVYSGYYQHPRVVEVLGLEPRAPHPKGYPMEADDLTLLEPVRRRGKIYREP